MSTSPLFRAHVRLLNQAESGRKTDFLNPQYRCRLIIAGEALDCCLYFSAEPPIRLGHEYDVQIEFLSADLARELISRDARFEIRDMKTIGTGSITGASLSG